MHLGPDTVRATLGEDMDFALAVFGERPCHCDNHTGLACSVRPKLENENFIRAKICWIKRFEKADVRNSTML
jgi:hypothetical protein